MKERIREVRKQLSLNQTDFGRKLGVSRGVIANLELGLTTASEVFISLMCNTFGIDRHWLETGEGEMYVRIETSSDLVARLASEKGLGPGGHALLCAVVRIMEELGPDALDRIIAETIPAIMRESGIGDPDKVDELMAARASAPAEPKISG